MQYADNKTWNAEQSSPNPIPTFWRCTPHALPVLPRTPIASAYTPLTPHKHTHLMPNIPDDLVLRRVEHVMQSDSELHHTQA
jgi:hypothetical protein